MSQPRLTVKDRTRDAPPTRAAAADERRRGRRESIESFVVVLVAFLVWSFEAEGFVIPTGSMAPTLMGRHKEITCPECGYVYQVNADCEVDSSGSGASTGLRVAWGTCENCRFEARVDDAPSSGGDRIYTMKSGLHIPFLPAAGKVGPGRWEVTVFKLPEEPEVRYIKRLVGLPGETIRIFQGDLWRRGADEAVPFERLHRPFAHQQAMQVTVYDDVHRAASLGDDPRWKRWTAADRGWTETTPGIYRSQSRSGQWSELRYRHVVPEIEQGRTIRAGQALETAPRETLITDFSSYNSDMTRQAEARARTASRRWLQPHWVGDLTLSATVEVHEPTGRLALELIKAGHSCRCEVDLETGVASLLYDSTPLTEPELTPLRGTGRHRIVLANVDDRLTLSVDGEQPFGDGISYAEAESAGSLPTDADLRPARIAARGSTVEISDLLLKRDIYYSLSPGEADHQELGAMAYHSQSELFDFLADPSRYAKLGLPPAHDYPLGAGRYLMLGDNSPWSRDGRAWGTLDQMNPLSPGRGWDDSGRESWEVPESLIIGKAFCVYWPHLRPVWPAFRLGEDFRLPARPYIERMRWIR